MSTDDQLMTRLRQGEALAWSEFIDQNRPQLLAFISRRLGTALSSKIEPDDILQETAISAMRFAGQSLIETRDPFSILCQVAEQRIIDAQRCLVASQKRDTDKEVGLNPQFNREEGGGWLDVLAASITSPSQAFSREERHLKLNQAISQLPFEAQEIIRLRFLENLPTKEIADRLGKSDGTIRVALKRALDRLQTLM